VAKANLQHGALMIVRTFAEHAGDISIAAAEMLGAKDRRQLASQKLERPSPSIIKILEGALRIVGSRGVSRLTMRDICAASRVSRATLYRNFSKKEEVLTAVAEYICRNFETGILEAAEQHEDPIDRFRAVMSFFSRYSRARSPEPMLELEPHFYLTFFRTHFARHKIAVGAAMERTFNHIDAKLKISINRQGVVEALIRMQLSTLMVPVDDDWADLWESAPDNLALWIANLGSGGKNRRKAKISRSKDVRPRYRKATAI
jgi:AcrR family transcriptional regulator